MALNVANIDAQLSGVASVVLGAPPNEQITVLKATACNVGATTRTITLYRVPNGGAPDPTMALVNALAIGAGATVVLPLSGQTLVSQQTFQAFADQAGAVNLNLSYAQTP